MTYLDEAIVDGEEIPWPDEPPDDDGHPDRWDDEILRREPRWPADDPGPSEPDEPESPSDGGYVAPASVNGHRRPETTQPDDAADEDRPRYVDVAAFLSATRPEPPRPVLLHRTDGHALFYAAKVNMAYGDPESGKTIIVLAACAEALRDGRTVLIIDLDHNGVDAIVPLLLELGAAKDKLSDPNVFRYYDDIDSALDMLTVVEDCIAWRPAVAVIDSIGELLPLMGADSNSADDFTHAHTKVLKPLARAGAVVIGVDHLAKNVNSRMRGPTGTGAKRRALSGLSLRVVVRRQFVPGKGGTADLYVNKDRHGGVRQHCPMGEREQQAGRFVMDAVDANGAIGWRVLPPPDNEAVAGATGQYLEAIRALMVHSFTLRDVAAAVSGEQAVTKGQRDQARYHIDVLTKAGIVAPVDGTRKGVPARFQLVETSDSTSELDFEDPASDATSERSETL